MRGRHKKWAEPYLASHPEVVISCFIDDPFFASAPLYLEIGSGKGDFVLGLAAKQPGHYLAMEREESIAGVLAKKVVESGRDDIRVAPLDFDAAAPLLMGLKFDSIYLNFSDPWPKKRHHKRRLTASPRLILMKSLLKKDGEILIKTDNVDLYSWSKGELQAAGFEILLDQPDYPFDEEHDAMSEYERNFRSAGAPIHRFIAKPRV